MDISTDHTPEMQDNLLDGVNNMFIYSIYFLMSHSRLVLFILVVYLYLKNQKLNSALIDFNNKAIKIQNETLEIFRNVNESIEKSINELTEAKKGISYFLGDKSDARIILGTYKDHYGKMVAISDQNIDSLLFAKVNAINRKYKEEYERANLLYQNAIDEFDPIDKKTKELSIRNTLNHNKTKETADEEILKQLKAEREVMQKEWKIFNRLAPAKEKKEKLEIIRNEKKSVYDAISREISHLTGDYVEMRNISVFN